MNNTDSSMTFAPSSDPGAPLAPLPTMTVTVNARPGKWIGPFMIVPPGWVKSARKGGIMVSMQKEPVAIGAALTSFATALIALLVGFEIVDWTPEQIGLVLGVVSGATVFVGALVRARVTPSQ